MQNLMAFFQVCLAFLSFFPVYILYLVFSPLKKEYPRRHVISIIMFVLLVLLCVIFGLVGLLLIKLEGPDATPTKGFAYGMRLLPFPLGLQRSLAIAAFLLCVRLSLSLSLSILLFRVYRCVPV